MERDNFPKDWRIYVSLVAVFVLLVLFFPKNAKFRYHYQVGRAWMYETLISPIDFPILKSDKELMAEREEKASSIIPYFRMDDNVYRQVSEGIYALRCDTSLVDNDYLASLFSQIYAEGLVSDMTEDESRNGIMIVQKERRAVEVHTDAVYDIKRARTMLKSHLAQKIGSVSKADSLYAGMNLDSFLVPNMKFDQETTELLHKEAVNYISPTKGIVYTGQLIVSEGEIVTAEILQLLDSFKAEYLNTMGFTGSTGWVVTGNALLLLAAIMIFFATIYFVNRPIFKRLNEFLYVLTLFTLCTFVTETLVNFSSDYLMMVPYPLFALYLFAFFDRKSQLPLYTSFLIPLLVVAPDGIEMFFINLVGGVVAIISFSRFNRGWLQFVNALFIFFALIAAYFSFMLIRNGGIAFYKDYQNIAYLGFAGIFCVAGYPLVFLFEKIFMLVSNSRLADLADTNNPILRDLAEKAPGTFQHALQVMNLSDACARAIGANVRLIRTGALYHDVGKMMNPQCFIENAAPGVNYHAGLTPAESARDIIRHVDDGMALARKYNVPSVVSDFILSHHGTSRTEYFYNVYVNSGGNPEDANMFEYHGFKPKTKEQAIVMMADTVEAASRSLKDYSEKSISELVDRMVNLKINDGQMTDADISLKEISTVKKVLKDYLLQINHARIAYPKRQER